MCVFVVVQGICESVFFFFSLLLMMLRFHSQTQRMRERREGRGEERREERKSGREKKKMIRGANKGRMRMSVYYLLLQYNTIQ